VLTQNWYSKNKRPQWLTCFALILKVRLFSFKISEGGIIGVRNLKKNPYRKNPNFCYKLMEKVTFKQLLQIVEVAFNFCKISLPKNIVRKSLLKF